MRCKVCGQEIAKYWALGKCERCYNRDYMRDRRVASQPREEGA